MNYLSREIIETGIRTMIDLHADDPKLHKLLFETLPDIKSIHNIESKLENELIEHFEKVFEADQTLKPTNKKLAARLVLQTIENQTHRFVLYDYQKLDESSFVEELSNMICSYLWGASIVDL